ncbi:hypothetical protein XFF7767_240132 [Xanthomonas citri pv. fuscans]|nr:hypothetical protein XFF7767_240132 [Xanthomonas citri pv. fuscans]
MRWFVHARAIRIERRRFVRTATPSQGQHTGRMP